MCQTQSQIKVGNWILTICHHWSILKKWSWRRRRKVPMTTTSWPFSNANKSVRQFWLTSITKRCRGLQKDLLRTHSGPNSVQETSLSISSQIGTVAQKTLMSTSLKFSQKNSLRTGRSYLRRRSTEELSTLLRSFPPIHPSSIFFIKVSVTENQFHPFKWQFSKLHRMFTIQIWSTLPMVCLKKIELIITKTMSLNSSGTTLARWRLSWVKILKVTWSKSLHSRINFLKMRQSGWST